MTDASKPQPTFQINQVGSLNAGDVTIYGDQIGFQKNQGIDSDLQATLSELTLVLRDLQCQHPSVTTETEALLVIGAEFSVIKRSQSNKLAMLRKQLLNPERHAQAIKATLGEVARHYLEESIWAKAAITYFDKMSETPDYEA